MKIVAFAASSSADSINKALVTYATSFLTAAECRILDLNDYELPLFSVDREKELGQPENASRFLQKIADADALLVAFAEHNNSYTAAWKNLFDWCTRIEVKVYQNKPMVLLSTSPGRRGGANVMEQARAQIPRFGGDIRAHLSIPSFHDNFNFERGELTDDALRKSLEDAVHCLLL